MKLNTLHKEYNFNDTNMYVFLVTSKIRTVTALSLKTIFNKLITYER
jgi:hypothetical protein